MIPIVTLTPDASGLESGTLGSGEVQAFEFLDYIKFQSLFTELAVLPKFQGAACYPAQIVSAAEFPSYAYVPSSEYFGLWDQVTDVTFQGSAVGVGSMFYPDAPPQTIQFWS